MTTKTITLAEEKVQTIQKGSVVKLGGDMFIVAELEHTQNVDPINDALFNPQALARTTYFHHNQRVEAKYNLVSFMTGCLFYNENYELRDLARKMSSKTFKVVDKVEFVESN